MKHDSKNCHYLNLCPKCERQMRASYERQMNDPAYYARLQASNPASLANDLSDFEAAKQR